MKNPWKEIENKQYILSTDLDRINEFNNNK
jgi:hypothetical protein